MKYYQPISSTINYYQPISETSDPMLYILYMLYTYICIVVLYYINIVLGRLLLIHLDTP